MRAVAPVVDARSTTAGGVLDSDELLRLPVARRLTSTLYLVPGVSSSSGAGDANPSIAGASGLENNYVVDGVNITEHGLRRRRRLLRTFRLAGHGRHHRLHQGDPGQDRGLRGGVRPGHRRRRQRRHRSGSNAFHGSLFGYFAPSGAGGRAGGSSRPRPAQVNTTRSQDLDFGDQSWPARS